MENAKNLQNEILTTRIGGLGSSDAAMVAKIGRDGAIGKTAQRRIAEMLEIEQHVEFTSYYTENGKTREQEIFEFVKNDVINSITTNAEITGNPYNKSVVLSDFFNFNIFNHIDIEAISDTHICWCEVKTTNKAVDETFAKYAEQLAWHNLILREKAKSLKKEPLLLLVHYAEDYSNSEFDVSKITIEPYIRNDNICDNIYSGLAHISKILPTFRDSYVKREELLAADLPSNIQQEIEKIGLALQAIKTAEKQVDGFKSKMLEAMNASGIDKITTDYFTITRVAASTATTFDSKKLKDFSPTIYEQYTKKVEKKEYIKIDLQKEKNNGSI